MLSWRHVAVLLFALALPSIVLSGQPAQRVWIGPGVWANRVQDWRLSGGRGRWAGRAPLECRPRRVDPTDPNAGQFDGWAVIIHKRGAER